MDNLHAAGAPEASSEVHFHENESKIVHAPSGLQAVVKLATYTGDAGPPLPVRPSPGLTLDDHDEPHSSAGVSSLNSVFTLCNSAIGAGVLSLPFAFRHAGLVGGLVMCFVLGSCEALTLYVLSKFAERYSAHSYVTLVRLALGRKLAAILSTVLVVYLFGSCIAYMVIIGDTFSSLAAEGFGAHSHLADRRVVITVMGVLVVLPLCFPRKLQELAFTNIVAVVGFAYTAVVVVYRGLQVILQREHPLEDVQLFRHDYGSLFALAIVVFGFNCHSTVVSIFSELERRPSQLIPYLPASPSGFRKYAYGPQPGTRRLIGMIGVIIAAMAIIMTGYMSVGAIGYLAYPKTVTGNILNTFPYDDTLMQTARAAIGVVVIGHFPLNHHPARTGFEHLVQSYFKLSTTPVFASTIFTSLFVFGTMAVAMVVSNLGDVLHILGGTASSFIIFFLPGLLLVNAAVVKHSRSELDKAEAAIEQSEASADPEVQDAGAALHAPLLLAASKGIKETGLIYAPRASWVIGVALITLSAAIVAVTLVTVVLH